MKKILFVLLIALFGVKASAQQTLQLTFTSDCNVVVNIYMYDPTAPSPCNALYSASVSVSGPFSGMINYMLPTLSWMHLGGSATLPATALIEHIDVSQSTSCSFVTVGFGPCALYPTNTIIPWCVCTPYSVNLSGTSTNANLMVLEM